VSAGGVGLSRLGVELGRPWGVPWAAHRRALDDRSAALGDVESSSRARLERLPEKHLAWFVIHGVEGMDLDPFYGTYRSDGHGRPAHEPSMMVARVLYA
jgi:hypothetical protein